MGNRLPNAHYWTLKLINNNFGPGDQLVTTESSSPDLAAQASITPSGRKILLVNTSNQVEQLNLGDVFAGDRVHIEMADELSEKWRHASGPVTISLAPFAIAVVSQLDSPAPSQRGNLQGASRMAF